MRIYEDAEFRLVVTDSSLGLAAVLFAAGAVLLGVPLLGADARARSGLSVSGGFLLLCAVLLLRTTRFVFDRAQRVRLRRIVDAVALIRARENLGLMEARRRIAEIEKQMAAD